MVVYSTKVRRFVKQQEIIGTTPQPRVLPDVQPNAWRHGHLFSIKEAGHFLEGWEWRWAKGSAVWAAHLVPSYRILSGCRGRMNSGQVCHCYLWVSISVWVKPRSLAFLELFKSHFISYVAQKPSSWHWEKKWKMSSPYHSLPVCNLSLRGTAFKGRGELREWENKNKLRSFCGLLVKGQRTNSTRAPRMSSGVVMYRDLAATL